LVVSASELSVGQFKLVPFRQLLVGNAPVGLARRPLALLSVLAEAGGALVTKDELIERVWSGNIVEENAIQAQIAAVRRALGSDAALLVTVHGLGYRLMVTPDLGLEESELPSIAALPFANLSDDADQAYFVDGLMEEIVTSLTRIRTLVVIASGSSLSLKGQDIGAMDAAKKLGVRYVLEGSVRRAGDNLRISVRLIDTANQGQIWAEKFDGHFDDFFALQEQVALAVAGVIEFSVQGAETRRSAHRPTKDLRSYDLYLQALVLFRTYLQHNMFKSLDLLEQALAIDPNFALALSQASACHAVIARFRWSNDPESNGRAMMDYVDRSLQTGGDDPQVLATAAMSYWAVGDVDGGGRLAARATDLNPGSSWPWLARGKIAVAAGDMALADDCLQRSVRLDPISPNRNLQVGGLATVRFAQRRFEEGLGYARDYVELAGQPLSFGMLAATYGQLGKETEAAEAFVQLRNHSQMALADIAETFFHDEDLQALFLQGLVHAEESAKMRPRSK
jgi:TolB-like protein